MLTQDKNVEKKTTKSFASYKDLVVFILFFILSTAFWVMNKLTKDYDTSFEVLPKMKNSFTGASYTDVGDNTLYIKANVSGLFIARMKFFPLHVTIDLDNVKLNKGQEVSIPVLAITDKIQEGLYKGANIISVLPDTIHYKVSENHTKKVPIAATFDIDFGAEYRQSGPIRFTPDSVTLSGSEDVLTGTDKVTAKIGEYKNIKESLEGSVMLDKLDNVICRPEKVTYQIPVDRCVETTVKIPITRPNLKGLTLLTNEVTVKYTIPIKSHKNVGAESFKIAVTSEDILNSISRKAPLIIEKKPSEALDIKLSPQFVEFLIREK